jgi:hypothetical protein
MEINSGFRDLLRSLNAAGVRYQDLGIWIQAERDNARLLLEALSAFGAPTAEVTPDDFTEPEVFFQIGVDAVRVDIMTSVTGLDFETAWSRRTDLGFGDVQLLPAEPATGGTPAAFGGIESAPHRKLTTGKYVPLSSRAHHARSPKRVKVYK